MMMMEKKERSKKRGPGPHEVIEAANADDEGRKLPDENVLAKVGGPNLDKAGIDNAGYMTKKGLMAGVDVFYNVLPPGMNIEDQECADIRSQAMKYVTDLGYPGDGWD